MRLADAARRQFAAAAFLAFGATAAEPRYGKVETFEPGKKYTCAPTADRKGWDCKELGAADRRTIRENGAAATPPPPSPPIASPPNASPPHATPAQTRGAADEPRAVVSPTPPPPASAGLPA